LVILTGGLAPAARAASNSKPAPAAIKPVNVKATGTRTECNLDM
jgi:hypothetical protein